MKRALFSAFVLGLPLVGCGDYSGEPKGSAGAPSGGSSVIPAGGSGDPGGSGGTGTATGGSAGAGGMSGGMAGSGGRETPPEAKCENVTACGGDAVGVWFATSSCLPITGIADVAGLGIGCMEAPVSGKLEVTGNWTVGADGMISDNTTTTGSVTLELAPPCLDVSGTVTMCDRIGAPLASAGFTTVDCVESTTTEGGCTCTGKVMQMGTMAWVTFESSKSGMYTAENNAITVKATKEVAYDYCVEGNFMHATPKTPTILGTVSGTVVFQKQP